MSRAKVTRTEWGYLHSDMVRVAEDDYEIFTNCVDDSKSMTFT